ncbi:MAG: purine-nucleoside phosphorylase [bacterium]|nr:purine-nucleoside phosphorylase [bacterium]
MVLDSVRYIKKKFDFIPQFAIVLGSGLGSVADTIFQDKRIVIPYSDIPNFPRPSVVGHQGNLVLGLCNKKPVAVMQGRFHLYEGHSAETVIEPIQVLAELGVKILILTNAAGGLNPRNPVGSLVVINDQINFMFKKIQSSNICLHQTVFDKTLIHLAQKVAGIENIKIATGVYIGALGPSYETPAEIRMFQSMGGDMIGMSTVLESVTANQLGLKVLGISCITNLAAGISQHKLNHQEVLDISRKTSYNLANLLKRIIIL